jgi:hypothetical protein
LGLAAQGALTLLARSQVLKVGVLPSLVLGLQLFPQLVAAVVEATKSSLMSIMVDLAAAVLASLILPLVLAFLAKDLQAEMELAVLTQIMEAAGAAVLLK